MKKGIMAVFLCVSVMSLLISGCSKLSETGASSLTELADLVKGKEEILYPVQVGGKWGFIDKTGKVVVQPQFYIGDESPDVFDQDLYPISENDKWGFIDRKGNVVVQPQYSKVKSFSEGLAGVWTTGGLGFIDRKGKMIIKPQQYLDTLNFHEGLAAVKKYDMTWEYIDTQGKVVITTQADAFDIYENAAGSFSEGLASIKIDGKWGFIDKTGKLVIPAQSDFPTSFKEGLALISNDSGSKFIDKEGKTVLQGSWDVTTSLGFSEGLAYVNGDENGFMDKSGKIVIPLQCNMAQPFTDGRAAVYLYDIGSSSPEPKAGVIDKTGKWIIEPQTDVAVVLAGGIIQIARYLSENDVSEYRYLDKEGQQIWPQEK